MKKALTKLLLLTYVVAFLYGCTQHEQSKAHIGPLGRYVTNSYLFYEDSLVFIVKKPSSNGNSGISMISFAVPGETNKLFCKNPDCRHIDSDKC